MARSRNNYSYTGLPSAAVMVRGTDDEAPYVGDFFRHYFSLGFDHIYVINTAEDSKYLTDSSHFDANRITILSYPRNYSEWQEDSLNFALKHVKEDWILNIDFDEYLILPTQNIQEFVRSIPQKIEKISIRWVSSLSTNYYESHLSEVFNLHAVKSSLYKTLARTNRVTKLKIHNAHTLSTDIRVEPLPYNEGIYIVHFATRNLMDLIGRIVGRNYYNDKSGTQQLRKLRDFLENPDYPEKIYPLRLLIYRVTLVFPLFTPPVSPLSLASCTQIDHELVLSGFKNKLAQLRIGHLENSNEVFESMIESKFSVKLRLLKNLPDPTIAERHLRDGLSYQNVAKEYASKLGQHG